MTHLPTRRRRWPLRLPALTLVAMVVFAEASLAAQTRRSQPALTDWISSNAQPLDTTEPSSPEREHGEVERSESLREHAAAWRLDNVHGGAVRPTWQLHGQGYRRPDRSHRRRPSGAGLCGTPHPSWGAGQCSC